MLVFLGRKNLHFTNLQVLEKQSPTHPPFGISEISLPYEFSTSRALHPPLKLTANRPWKQKKPWKSGDSELGNHHFLELLLLVLGRFYCFQTFQIQASMMDFQKFTRRGWGPWAKNRLWTFFDWQPFILLMVQKSQTTTWDDLGCTNTS